MILGVSYTGSKMEVIIKNTNITNNCIDWQFKNSLNFINTYTLQLTLHNEYLYIKIKATIGNSVCLEIKQTQLVISKFAILVNYINMH